MEALRKLAEQDGWGKNDFPPTTARYSAVQFTKTLATGSVTSQKLLVSEPELDNFFHPEASSTPSPETLHHFRILLLPFPSRDTFSQALLHPPYTTLLRLIHADPYVQHLLQHDYAGLFHLPATVGTTTSAYHTTAYCGTPLHKLIWTFPGPSDPVTRALILTPTGPEPHSLDALTALFATIAEDVFFPLVPSLALTLHIARRREKFLAQSKERMRALDTRPCVRRFLAYAARAQAQTAVGGSRVRDGEQDREEFGRDEMDELADWWQELGRQALSMAVVFRSEIMDQLLAHVETSLGLVVDSAAEGRAMRESIVQAVDVLRKQSRATLVYIQHLQERSRSQSSLIFALLSQENSKATMALARAGTKIAEATRQDSSSMKTIAVVTMCFLPATFLSSLFSMPALRWDQPDVVQPGFGLYWAITIPLTLLVFAVWLGGTSREGKGAMKTWLGMAQAWRRRRGR